VAPLEALGDQALGVVGGLCLRGDSPLQRQAPQLIDWLGSEACREQARRRGEPVGAVEPLELAGLTREELVGALAAAAFLAVAARRVGVDRFGTDEAEELAICEVLGLFETIAEAVRQQLARSSPGNGTMH
jgi:hypothetical protein